MQKGLPSCPHKKREVIASIAHNYGLSLVTPPTPDTLVTQPNETQEVLKAFFYNDDVSRAAPGMRDFITINKEARSIRYLMSTLRESYLKFKEEHPQTKLAFSTCAAIRATICPEVLLCSDMPHSTCLCTIHENFIK
jgi:hypothetical protein